MNTFDPNNMAPQNIPAPPKPVDSSGNVRKDRPVAQTRKEFKNVLQGKDDPDLDEEIVEEEDEAKALSGRSKSIFDLSAKSKAGEKVKETLHQPKTFQTETPTVQAPPTDLSGLVNAPQVPTPKFDNPNFAQEASDLSSVNPNAKPVFVRVTSDDKSSSQDSGSFGKQPDLAGMAPPPTPIFVSDTATVNVAASAATAAADLQVLIDQLVSSAAILQSSGETQRESI